MQQRSFLAHGRLVARDAALHPGEEGLAHPQGVEPLGHEGQHAVHRLEDNSGPAGRGRNADDAQKGEAPAVVGLGGLVPGADHEEQLPGAREVPLKGEAHVEVLGQHLEHLDQRGQVGVRLEHDVLHRAVLPHAQHLLLAQLRRLPLRAARLGRVEEAGGRVRRVEVEVEGGALEALPAGGGGLHLELRAALRDGAPRHALPGPLQERK
mmetsp:Transcript_5255/g.17705  ORF Transcript_5255/g.17705 Transcript_5255/m.17705 type:complete len:209 (+) Transcript_5255:2258-2884(+)